MWSIRDGKGRKEEEREKTNDKREKEEEREKESRERKSRKRRGERRRGKKEKEREPRLQGSTILVSLHSIYWGGMDLIATNHACGVLYIYTKCQPSFVIVAGLTSVHTGSPCPIIVSDV